MRMSGLVYIRTFGCQMNEKDSERMRGLLLDAGYGATDDPGEADVVLINTCSVREKPERKVFSEAGRFKAEKERRPGLVLGVGGCVAQQMGEELLKKIPHLDLVFGTQTVHRLPELIARAKSGERVGAVEWLATDDLDLFAVPTVYTGHPVTAFVSIMQGCDNHCAYCIVPQVRGQAVCRPAEDVLNEARSLAEKGVREITLLGQNVNAYFDGKTTFPKLLSAAAEVPGILRARFTTSHPRDLGRETIQAIKDHPRVMPHLHLPVQAGADRVLQLMNRGYSRGRYLELVDELRAAVPEIGLTTDLIVGFPGETEADFQETLSLLDRVRYDETFSFRYSPRPGTPAGQFADQVPEKEKYERLYRLQDRQRTITEEKNQAEVGRVHEALIEGPSKTDPSRLSGRTPTNRLVHFPEEGQRPGEVVQVKIVRALKHSLAGEALPKVSLLKPSIVENCCPRSE